MQEMHEPQDRIFAQSEGDAWYRRNAAHLTADRPDVLLDLVQSLPEHARAGVGSICDVGCSSGDRLARFAGALPAATTLCGFDASTEATREGTARFPGLDLRQGLADSPPFDGPFDLVIVSFVLHWVDRSHLAKAIAAIDGLVADGGILLLSDFLPDRPCARRYHHRQDVSLFTYKQDYAAAFTGLGLYREVARRVFAHDDPSKTPSASTDQDRAMGAVLVKSTNYPEVTA